jgi:hypothetical protein
LVINLLAGRVAEELLARVMSREEG